MTEGMTEGFMRTAAGQMKRLAYAAMLAADAARRNAVAGVMAAGAMPAMAGLSMALADEDNSIDIKGGFDTIIGWVTTILMGVGIVYTLIGAFSFVQSIRQEEPERQTKATMNVIIGVLLVLIKPISKAVLNAMGANTEGFNSMNTQ